MNTIKPISAFEVLEQRIEKIKKNTAWIQTGKKIEIALLMIAFLGCFSFAMGAQFGHLNTLSSSTLLSVTFGGVVVPCVLGLPLTEQIKKHLKKQNQALEEHVENWLFNALFNDCEKGNILHKLTNKQWTRLIKDTNDDFNRRKPKLEEKYWNKEIKFAEQLLNYPKQLADNFFFIDRPFYELLMHSRLKDEKEQLIINLGEIFKFQNNFFGNPLSENPDPQTYATFILTAYGAFTNTPSLKIEQVSVEMLNAIHKFCKGRIEKMMPILTELRQQAKKRLKEISEEADQQLNKKISNSKNKKEEFIYEEFGFNNPKSESGKASQREESINTFKKQSKIFIENWQKIMNAVTKT